MVGGLRPSGSPARRHQNCGFFRELSCESAQVEKRFPRSSVLPRKARSRLPFHSILRIFHASIPSDSSTTTRTSETDEKSKVHWSDSIRLFFYISFWRSEIMLRAWNRRRAWILSCWIHGQWPNSLSIILTVTYGRVLSSSRPASCCGVSFDCGWHSRSIYFCAFFTLFFWCGVVRWHKHKIKTNHTASLVVKARFNRR